MGEEQLSRYAMYISSLGNRPDIFPQSGYVSQYYVSPPADYEVPAALLGPDEKFARLMEEADISSLNIKHACCIDKSRLERIGNYQLKIGKDKNQRSICGDRKSTRLNSSHSRASRMPSSA